MSKDEISVMDGSKCILQLRGVRPFLSDKYDITKHPNYRYTADFEWKGADEPGQAAGDTYHCSRKGNKKGGDL